MQSTILTLRKVYTKPKEDKERLLAEEKHFAEAGLFSPWDSPDAAQNRDVIPKATLPIALGSAEA